MNPFPPAPAPGSPVSAAWMARVLAACRMCMPIAGPGLRASYTQHGTVLTLGDAKTAPEKEHLRPFTVRWHQPEDAAGQWEIYMPAGCISIGSSCSPLNPPASDTTGHDGETGWYLLPMLDTPSAGDSFSVIVHAKQRAVAADDLPGSGDPDAAPAVLAWIHKNGLIPSQQSAEARMAYAGDGQSFTAATITYSAGDEGGDPVSSVSQPDNAVVRYPGEADREFDLWWAFDVTSQSLSVEEMGLLRRTLSTGTDVARITDPVDVTDAAQGIYLRVRNQGGATELTVALDVNDTTAGTDFFIVQLYEVNQYHVTSDYRSALWRLPMYLGGGS